MRRKDYHIKKYKNPHFDRKKKAPRKLRFILFFFLFTVFAFGYFVFFTPLFTIRDLEITNLDNIKEKSIMDLFDEQKQNNILLFQTKKLRNEIMKRYVVKDVIIKKNIFDRKLEIYIDEKIAILVWISQSKGYYVDERGVVVTPVTAAQLSENNPQGKVNIIRHKIVQENLPVVYDITDSDVVTGESVVFQDVFSFLKNLIQELTNNIPHEIAHYNFDMGNRMIIAQTVEGWQMYFSIDGDATYQVNNVKTLLQEKIKNFQGLEYIDVRFGEKVYYK